jgi:predicted DNA-binding transcriptional regulator YafY
MGTADRRSAILKILCSRRYEKMSNLAEELGVSERTIRRDIEVLSYTEPIYTRQGRYDGGVYVLDGYYNKKMYLSEEEGSFIRKVYKAVSSSGTYQFSSDEVRILEKILKTYAKPEIENNGSVP